MCCAQVRTWQPTMSSPSMARIFLSSLACAQLLCVHARERRRQFSSHFNFINNAKTLICRFCKSSLLFLLNSDLVCCWSLDSLSCQRRLGCQLWAGSGVHVNVSHSAMVVVWWIRLENTRKEGVKTHTRNRTFFRVLFQACVCCERSAALAVRFIQFNRTFATSVSFWDAPTNHAIVVTIVSACLGACQCTFQKLPKQSYIIRTFSKTKRLQRLPTSLVAIWSDHWTEWYNWVFWHFSSCLSLGTDVCVELTS